ncbi:hypothetical protein GCM10023176_08210 [Micromonospora coerulea]|uniref:Uncharacterized protein n=1 Tax=Micromonospora coerulea TaxID=47856 RepID=A0ABP8S784_9ACTN
MSFDLVVLAVEPATSLDDMRRMIEHCASLVHRDGEPDPRIIGFYEELQESLPDHPPYDRESPWMSAPLAVGIDHVSMSISHSPRGTKAVQAVCQLAERHGLVIYDPQGNEVTGLDLEYRTTAPLGD